MKISTPLPAKVSAWSESLAREPDPELRGEGYLRLANKLSQEELGAAASEIYGSLLAEASLPTDLRRKAQASLDLLSGRGIFGQRFEFWSRNFIRHAADPASLAAMTAGGLAFRLVRFGVAKKLLSLPASLLTRGIFAAGAAGGAGFSAEVLTFASTARWLAPSTSAPWSHDLARASLSLGALKVSGAAGSTLIKRGLGLTSASKAISPRLLQQSALFSGILLGAHLEKRAGLREQDLDLWDGLSTLLHFNVGGILSRHWLGESFARWERGLDQRFHEISPRGPLAFAPHFAWAGAALQGKAGSKEKLPELHRLLTESHGNESELPSQTRAQALRKRYLPLFPSPELGARSEEILLAACRIRCELPKFHEHILEALLRAPKPGSREQLYLVLAIEDVFASDALRTATGSFDYALLQLLLGRAIAESDGPYRNQVLHKIFRGMEAGRSRDYWMQLAEQLGYTMEPPFFTEPQYTHDFWQAHRAEAGEAWAGYRPRDGTALFNFAYHHSRGAPRQASRIIQTFGSGRQNPRYPAADFDAAMDYARNISHGEMVLQRLHDILATGDSPAKLLEITRAPGSNPTLSYILNQLSQGRTRESLAFEINGSAHTAYFNDVRLARKVLSVLEDVAPYLHDASLMPKNKGRILDAFGQWAAQGRALEVPDLFKLLETNSHPVTESFTLAWMARKFEVELLTPDSFDRRVAEWGRTKDCTESIFFSKGGREGQPSILIKDIPDLDLGNEMGRRHAFGEVMSRVKALAHEAEHWRHITGNFFGTERGSRPLQLVDVSREERYISEIMAYLEDFRWRAHNMDLDFWEISQRLGEPLTIYLRGMADRSYFGHSNDTKALR